MLLGKIQKRQWSARFGRHAHSLLLYYSCAFSGGVLGDSRLDEYEALADLRAEWVELAKLDGIVIGTTIDWRPVVKQHLASSVV